MVLVALNNIFSVYFKYVIGIFEFMELNSIKLKSVI